MNDREITELIIASREKGYCALADKYTNYVLTVIYSVIRGCGTMEDAEECAADVFVKLVMDTSWADKERDSLKAFIGVSARNAAVNLYYRLSGRARYMSDDEIPENIFPQQSPEIQISGNELRELFWENVRQLGSPDSDIITAQYLYGIPVKEIASALGMNTAAVHKRSRRARKKLEKIFDSQFKKGIIRKEDFYETG